MEEGEKCPRCGIGKMYKVGERNGVKTFKCDHCGGNWFEV